ncbi:hypothetical protein K2Z83_03645 [Oscillochloris sp. ZM17-4]|uniref:hypothetical protein n=1 Tax=Oscillochloris sp. ZM17-4 TaxID=2866714 RepID=UPI001C732B8F|nr:hypothetical protein [Oscillochloris sp. ZM17-4]MBX0326774.1 hypothetical protein [Oscillochloris sp. ZM17-4]
MASPKPTPGERSVTRTYRAAIRLGEDFITLEETVTLPLDASDEDVQRAVDLGWRIYAAQRDAVAQQVAGAREGHGQAAPITVRDPDSPASDKQRNYIAALQDDLSWTNEQLGSYAGEHSVDLVTMTKGQASSFIDSLKKVADDRTRYGADQGRARAVSDQPAGASQPASEKQLQALARIAQTRALSLDAETSQRFGVASEALSDEQARALLSEWQSRPRPQRA